MHFSGNEPKGASHEISSADMILLAAAALNICAHLCQRGRQQPSLFLSSSSVLCGPRWEVVAVLVSDRDGQGSVPAAGAGPSRFRSTLTPADNVDLVPVCDSADQREKNKNNPSNGTRFYEIYIPQVETLAANFSSCASFHLNHCNHIFRSAAFVLPTLGWKRSQSPCSRPDRQRWELHRFTAEALQRADPRPARSARPVETELAHIRCTGSSTLTPHTCLRQAPRCLIKTCSSRPPRLRQR